jgi:hypothetical protein
MCRQLIAMGMGMGRMSWGENRFRKSLMLPVGQGIFRGVMAGIIQVTFTVLAWPGFYSRLFLPALFRRHKSWGHTQ